MGQHRRTAAGEGLAGLLARQRGMLVTSALAGGLARVRKRSSPSRIAWEADRFVRLLGRALASDDDRKLEALVRTEVRLGALAVASPDESDAVLAVWRRTLRASFLHIEPDSRARMNRVLADLTSRA